MAFRFALRGSSDRGVLSSGKMLAVIRLAHGQVNVYARLEENAKAADKLSA
jgi:hypothetical protein